MRSQPLLIDIPKPCGEDWDKMQTVSGHRRYCNACARTLTDFTTFTDREVHRELARSNGRICGRFRPDQLARPIYATPPRASRWRVWATAAGILLSGSIAAQLTVEPPAYAQPVSPQETVALDTLPPTITGIVTDGDGIPLAGAVITVREGEILLAGTLADSDGIFELPPVERGEVRITYLGFAPLVTDLADVRADGKYFLDVVMRETVYVREEIVVVAYQVVGKQDFMGGPRISEIPEANSSPPIDYRSYLAEAAVFPNPFADHLFVSFVAEHAGTLSVELYATDGRVLKRWPAEAFTAGDNRRHLSVRELRRLIPGHYFLQLTDGDGRQETRVVIKGN